jgi:hypothetical protein
MIKPFEYVSYVTIVDQEVRIDPESKQEYVEDIVIAEDKKVKCISDVNDILRVEEYVDEKGKTYRNRSVVFFNGTDPKVIGKSYNDIKEMIFSNETKVGFHG